MDENSRPPSVRPLSSEAWIERSSKSRGATLQSPQSNMLDWEIDKVDDAVLELCLDTITVMSKGYHDRSELII